MVHDIRWVEKVKLQKCSRARVVVGGESFEYVATKVPTKLFIRDYFPMPDSPA